MNKNIRSFFIYFIPFIVICVFLYMLGSNAKNENPINLTQFITEVQRGNVKTITRQGEKIKGQFKDGKAFVTVISGDVEQVLYNDYLKDQVEAGKITYTALETPVEAWYIRYLPTFISLAALFFLFYIILSQTQNSGNGKVMNFGKSRARLNSSEGENKVTFDDVAGLVEEKEELFEIVDFLKKPKKYIQIGARIPKGVLLIGPPGTGKTYLSRAVAGEAGVPFFSISGSDFVEMFVGVGASRVRDLFEEAKKNAPCIVFIDEIDAVARKRGAGVGGGHDEREQTLNQLLVEMDGFGTNEGIIIMAATNRPDILDPAILRPGRFDREVFVGLPDVREREAILKIHTRNKKLDSDVSLENIAKRTSGFSPADLENVCNEAALLTARKNLSLIPASIFEEAAIKVVAGPEKKSAVVIEKEKILTAYHESGHAIVSRLLPDTDQVHMITIIPRGRAGGFTAYLPKEEKNYGTKKQMQHDLISLLGGRAAEELVLGDISTGATNDIERATKIARNMVTKYGMSKVLGPMAYDAEPEEVFLGNEIGKRHTFSEKVADQIDSEMRRFIDEAYDKARFLLGENLSLLHKLAQELLENETLTGERFEQIYQEFTNQDKTVREPQVVQKIKERDDLIEEKLSGEED